MKRVHVRKRMRDIDCTVWKYNSSLSHRKRRDGDGRERQRAREQNNKKLRFKIMTLCTYFVLSEHLLYKTWLSGWHKYWQYLTAHKWSSDTYSQNYSLRGISFLWPLGVRTCYNHVVRNCFTHLITHQMLSLSLKTKQHSLTTSIHCVCD